MREVWVNHKLVDFTNAARQHKVTAGCAMLEGTDDIDLPPQRSNFPGNEDDDLMGEQREDVRGEELPEDPCLLHVCKAGGSCVVSRPGEAICKCPPGFSGKNCELGMFWSLSGRGVGKLDSVGASVRAHMH